MKKGLILAILAALVVCMSAEAVTDARADEMKAIVKTNLSAGTDAGAVHPRATSRVVPDFSFITTPQNIISSYYDYMPGSYCNTPLHVQNNNAPGNNGAYLSFHATETANATRRVYLSYVNPDGTVNSTGYVSNNDLSEGYSGSAIDYDTQDPFFVWHCDTDQDDYYEVPLTYDMWNMLQSPGLVATPVVILDPQDYAGVYTPQDDDEFIWPYIYIVHGPTYDTDGSRRMYICASNYTTHTENPSENELLVWADFTTGDVEAGNFANLTWHYVTFELLDNYNNNIPGWGRYQKSFAVNDNGQIAMIGFLSADDVENGSDLLIFYNDNWAEGDWDLIQTDANFFTTAPAHEDGVTCPLEGVEVGDPIFYSFEGSHPMAAFDGQNRLHFFDDMICGYMNPEDDKHYVWQGLTFTKGVIYDPATGDITWQDVYPQSTCEDPTFPYCSWDPDQDGVFEYTEDGYLVRDSGWPVYWYDYEDSFHENTFRIASNPECGYMAYVWEDGLYSYFYNVLTDESYIDWETSPEIAISLSADNGENWSEPIFMNAVPTAEVGYCTELSGMIPAYVYPSDYIEDLGDGHGKLHLFFYDDNSYGSYNQGNGANDGGMLKYASLDLDFTQLPQNAVKPETQELVSHSLTNYPNPFNPVTTVQFSLAAQQNVELKIYNVRGELVKTLCQKSLGAGKHTFTWTGSDNSGSPVASGVYFARLNAGNTSETSKMLLLK